MSNSEGPGWESFAWGLNSLYEEFRCLPALQGQEDAPIFTGVLYTRGPLGTVAGNLKENSL